jgi:hypothetical protein
LQDPTSQGVSERINIDFSVDNVDVLASLLRVVDEEALGSLELGPLLHTDYFLPCLLSVIQVGIHVTAPYHFATVEDVWELPLYLH